MLKSYICKTLKPLLLGSVLATVEILTVSQKKHKVTVEILTVAHMFYMTCC